MASYMASYRYDVVEEVVGEMHNDSYSFVYRIGLTKDVRKVDFRKIELHADVHIAVKFLDRYAQTFYRMYCTEHMTFEEISEESGCEYRYIYELYHNMVRSIHRKLNAGVAARELSGKGPYPTGRAYSTDGKFPADPYRR